MNISATWILNSNRAFWTKKYPSEQVKNPDDEEQENLFTQISMVESFETANIKGLKHLAA